MNDNDDRVNDARTLHRMITYLRSEAVRLHIMDVATLLEHAEDAVVGFSLAGTHERGRGPCEPKRSGADH